LGPRRTLAALAALALAVVVVTAGVAAACGVAGGHQDDGHDRFADGASAAHAGPGAHDGAWSRGVGSTGAGGPGVQAVGAPVAASAGERPAHATGATEGEEPEDEGGVQSTGAGSAAVTGPVDVTVTDTGTLPASGGAPAAAASGPAPDAAAAAPSSGVVTDTDLAAGGTTDAPGAAVPAPDFAPVTTPAAAPATGLGGIGDFSVLGSIGDVANQVTDGHSATRALLGTGPGRSLRVIGALLAAIVVFLFVHRHADKGDRKLTAAPSGPEVARFR
jgi:hypothetical protein